MAETSYFSMVEHPTMAKSAHELFYTNAGSDVIRQFSAINGLNSPNAMLYPGQFVIAPGLDGVSEANRAQMAAMGQQLNFTARNGAGAANPQLFNSNASLLDLLANSKGAMEGGGRYVEGIETYLSTRLQSITQDFKELERIYRMAGNRRLNLMSPEFRSMKQGIEGRLRAQLTGISSKAVLQNAKAPSMKDALGISHRSLNKSIRGGRGITEVKGITKALENTSKLSKGTHALKNFGAVLSFGTGVAAVAEDYKNKGGAAAVQTMGRESAGFLGSTAGGALGAKMGAGGAAAALVVFGVGTGGAGFVVIGIAAVAGGFIGAYAGGEAGKEAFDYTSVKIEKGLEPAMDWIIQLN